MEVNWFAIKRKGKKTKKRTFINAREGGGKRGARKKAELRGGHISRRPVELPEKGD